MPQRRYRVGIDCRLSGQRHAGIGRYTENLVRQLLQQPTEIDWILFFSDQEQANQVLEVTPPGACQVVLAPYRHYSLMEQLKLPAVFSAQQLDLLHIPHFNLPFFYGGEVILTIHDLLWHEYRGAAVTTLPKWQYWLKYVLYRLTVDHAMKRAKRVIVPAQTVADQVSQYYPQSIAKISVVPEGVDERFFRVPAKRVSKYLVYLGSLYPHKNVRLVVEALQRLPEYSLRIVSSRTVFQDQLREYVAELGLTDRVSFLGYQTDEQVAELLSNGFALVQPSLSEGFGLTGLEAMAAGTPVIASDIPIFKEVYQNHAFFFTSKDVTSFVAAVQQVAQSERQQRLLNAQAFVKKYQWSKMAKSILSIYKAQLVHAND